MPFIIDGHNLLHTIYKAEGDSHAISDIQLCHIVNTYLKRIGETGQIIFDGTGPRDKSPFDNISNIEVLFAGLGTDTDTVIEEKIQLSTAPKRLSIVSSDRRLRKAANTRKAKSIKSDAFWSVVQKRLQRRRKIQEPPAKRHGLTQSETEQWLDFFGLKQ
jgi:predicted RNA-binding protein with PIN domain